MKNARPIVALLAVLLSTAAAAEVPLIPRDLLFAQPQRSAPQISPDGTRLAWVAPDERGVGNVYVQTIGSDATRPVTNERHHPVYSFAWAGDGAHLLYMQDTDGDENTHLFLADMEGRNVRDLTPFRGVRADNLLTSPNRPDQVVVAMNLESRDTFDLYRIDITTGALTIEARNNDVSASKSVDVLSWTADENLVVRGVTTYDRASGRTGVSVRDDARSPWREIVSWPFEQTPVYFGQAVGATMIAAFEPGGRSIDVFSSADSDTLQVVRLDTATGKKQATLLSHPKADPVMWEGSVTPVVATSPRTGALQGVAYAYLTPEWLFTDADVKADFDTIQRKTGGFITIGSRDAADRKWVVTAMRSDAPESYFLFDRATKAVTAIFDSQPELMKYTLVPKEPVVIRSRDGQDLVSYVSYPAGVARRSLPLVVYAHGGPYYRDHASFDPYIQHLANRGYAVLQVNYRGSEGFGRRFVNLATRQWGLATNDDLVDAVRWAVRQGIADPKRIAAAGASGGGYATLRLLTENPDLFVCGTSFVGPADVRETIESFPAYWGPSRDRFLRRVGDVIHDDAFNRKISPLYHVDALRAPLLIQQGGNDVRVRITTVDRFVKTLRDAGRAVTYVVYPDEGHLSTRPPNVIDGEMRFELFLQKYLGGRAEPEKTVPGTSAEVR